MLLLFLSLYLFIPSFENILVKTTFDSKIEKYLSAGITDSAEYFAQKLLKSSRNLKTRKKALLYLYRIYKYSGNEKDAYNTLQELLKLSNHSDSIAFYIDYFTHLYKSKKLNHILELKDEIPLDDTLYFIISLTMFNLNHLDSVITYTERCHLKEAKYLKAFALYKLGRYYEAESLSKNLNWKELTILSFAQQQRWDSIAFSLEHFNMDLNNLSLPYLRVLYFLSLRKSGKKIPLSYYEEWLIANKGNSLEDYVSLLFAEDLGRENQWSRSLQILNTIDTVQFFSKYPSLKADYFWTKGKALYYKRSNLKRITQHLVSALNLTQDPVVKDSCNYLLGLTYLKFAHYKKAIQYLQKVKENSHLYYDASYNLASAYYQILQYDDALEIIDEVLKKPNIPEESRLNILSIKANIYESKKEYSKAISTYQTMLQYVTQKPKIYEIYLHIELLKYKRGDYKNLKEVYQNYLSKFPESPLIPQLSYDLLFNYIYSEEKENAREILLYMIDKFPQNQKTLEAISLYFSSPVASLKDSTILKNLLLKNPELEDYIHLTLGRFYKRLRLYDDALKSFEVVKQGNYYSQAQVEIMEIYFLLNKYTEVEMLGREIMPEEIREYTSYRIVELLLKALKNEGKVSTFNSLANYFAGKDFPFKKDFCLMVSDLYIREKDTTNAIKFLNIARDLGATDQEIINYNVELLKILKENTQ